MHPADKSYGKQISTPCHHESEIFTEANGQTHSSCKKRFFKNGMSYLKAAVWFHLPKSILHEAVRYGSQKIKPASSSRHPGFKFEVEEVIFETLNPIAYQGVLLANEHLYDALTIFIERLTEFSNAALPVKNRRPGVNYIREFESRHSSELNFSSPFIYESKIFTGVNTKTITTHLSIFEKLVRDSNIFAARMWNLDKNGTIRVSTATTSLGKGATCTEELTKIFTTRLCSHQTCDINVRNKQVMRNWARIFVFKVKRLSYQKAIHDCIIVTKTYTTILARYTCHEMREEWKKLTERTFMHGQQRFRKMYAINSCWTKSTAYARCVQFANVSTRAGAVLGEKRNNV